LIFFTAQRVTNAKKLETKGKPCASGFVRDSAVDLVMKILITGGAGFIGSNLALCFANGSDAAIVAFDNLHRRGSELALPRLRASGVDFVHGDVRNPEDFGILPPVDLVIECSAEPSVHAGYDSGARYLVNTNLLGTINCLDYARRCGAAVIFLSTSRVYSIAALRALPLRHEGSRLALLPGEHGPGWSGRGISEDFPISGPRSLYGATKLASELLIEEYGAAYRLNGIVNRCSVITGPWQMGKVDQGFFALWAARHCYSGALGYSGFGGMGFQVRDVLHVADLYELISLQAHALEAHAGKVYNVGGGPEISISLAELTELCSARTGRHLQLGSDPVTRPADVPFYVTDSTRVRAATGWAPTKSVVMILDEILEWLGENRPVLAPILA
jgi:CDP-paratose 2-epimerase